MEENKIAYTTIPAHKINVAAGEVSAKTVSEPEKLLEKPPSVQKPVSVKKVQTIVPEIKQKTTFPSYIIMALGIAGALIIALTGLVFYLWQKVSVQDKPLEGRQPPIISPANEDKISLGAIKDAKTAEELKNTLQLFAHQHWNAQRNASLMSIYALLKEKSLEAKKLFSDLDETLYAGGDVDLETLKKNLYTYLKSINSGKKKQGKNSMPMKKINPS